MTAKTMPYKSGFGPFAGEVYRAPLSYPFRDGGRRRRRGGPRRDRPDREAGRRREPGRRSSSSRSRARAASSSPRRASSPRSPTGAARTTSSSSPTRCRPASPAPARCSPCDHEGVVPDLIVTAKGIAGGLPLSAVTGRAEIMDAPHVGGLGGTYGGNPIACAAALAVIETIEDDGLVDRAREIEKTMVERLTAPAADATRAIGDVRGRGAMIAVELVEPGTDDPDADAHQAPSPPPRTQRGVDRADLRHLRQRAAVPAAAVDPRPPARRGARRARRRLRRDDVDRRRVTTLARPALPAERSLDVPTPRRPLDRRHVAPRPTARPSPSRTRPTGLAHRRPSPTPARAEADGGRRRRAPRAARPGRRPPPASPLRDPAPGLRADASPTPSALAALIVAENGKSLADARAEVTYAAEFFRWFAEEAVRTEGEYGASPGRRHPHDRDPPAGRRRRAGHAVELPGRHGDPQDRAGARRRLHRRPQAGRRDAADRAGRWPGSCSEAGVPDGRGQRGADHRRGRGRRRPGSSDPRVRKLSFTGSTAGRPGRCSGRPPTGS